MWTLENLLIRWGDEAVNEVGDKGTLIFIRFYNLFPGLGATMVEMVILMANIS